ncbi:MAG: hypothetical protein LC734_04235, partial [Acidobacteria bacterium]|nr:hypothetical protein [Acidobacteriota bacterium]
MRGTGKVDKFRPITIFGKTNFHEVPVLRNSSLLILILLLAGIFPTVAQVPPQLERARQRMEAQIRAEEDRRRRERGEIDPSAPPKPKVAAMNVDVQAVLSKADHPNFALAKTRTAVRVADGDPLWLYLKFNGKLGDYVRTTAVADEPGKFRYQLFVEIGPKGDVRTLNEYVLEFAKEDLAMQELKINLAPGLMGRNRSIPVFLMASAAARPGLW